MNPFLKRTLVVAATAPMAFALAMGPAGASSTDVDLGVVANPTAGGYTIDCASDNNPVLRFTTTLFTEGPTDGDVDDIDHARVQAVDEDYDNSSPYFELDYNVKSIKIEFFSDDADEFNDKPDRILRRTERVRGFQDGKEEFNTHKDDVGFVRTTVEWEGPTGDDEDDEELSCLVPLDGNAFP